MQMNSETFRWTWSERHIHHNIKIQTKKISYKWNPFYPVQTYTLKEKSNIQIKQGWAHASGSTLLTPHAVWRVWSCGLTWVNATTLLGVSKDGERPLPMPGISPANPGKPGSIPGRPPRDTALAPLACNASFCMFHPWKLGVQIEHRTNYLNDNSLIHSTQMDYRPNLCSNWHYKLDISYSQVASFGQQKD
jgi:hypothetical protein